MYPNWTVIRKVRHIRYRPLSNCQWIYPVRESLYGALNALHDLMIIDICQFTLVPPLRSSLCASRARSADAAIDTSRSRIFDVLAHSCSLLPSIKIPSWCGRLGLYTDTVVSFKLSITVFWILYRYPTVQHESPQTCTKSLTYIINFNRSRKLLRYLSAPPLPTCWQCHPFDTHPQTTAADAYTQTRSCPSDIV